MSSDFTAITKANDFLSSKAIAARAVLVLAVAYLLVGYLTLSPGHAWGDDWAQYVNHARNLASGRAYSDTGYIFNPEAPHVGPPSYSPGFPLLIAPIVRVFGTDVVALKSVGLVCMTAATLLTFLLFRDALGPGVAAAAAFLFGLHDFSWSLRNYIISEPSYIFWTLLCLYVASREVRGRGLVSGALCGLFAYAAFATRPIGIVLIVAVLAYETVQRRLFTGRFLCMAAIPAAGIELQRHLLSVADYSAELHVPTLADVAKNAAGYWQATADLFPLGSKLTLLSPIVVVGLALLGIGYRLRPLEAGAGRSEAPPVPARLGRPLLRRIPVDVWYLGLYCGALVLLPFETLSRYVEPILPILCAYAVYAIRSVLQGTRYARPAILALCVTGVFYYAALHWTHGARRSSGDDALCPDCRAMYTFIRATTEPGARVGFAKPRAMALLAARPSWVWAGSRERRFNWEAVRRTHIAYLVVVSPTHPLASSYPAELGWNAWRSNPNLRLMFENASFRVLRLDY